MGRLLVVALAVAALAAPAAATADAVPPDAIALVAGRPILRAAFDTVLAQVQRAYDVQNRAFPAAGTVDYRELKDQIVAFLVQREEFAQKAEQLGLVVTDADVAARLDKLKQQYFGGDDAAYQQALAKQGLTDEDVRAQIRDQLVGEAIFAAVTAGITVTDTEAHRYYATHRSRFVHHRSRVVRYVIVRTRALAQRLYDRIAAGASFAALARKYSIDPTARRTGGRLTIEEGETVRAFDRVAFSLRTGEVSRPFRSRYGWHIVEALSPIRPAHVVPFSRARQVSRAAVLEQKREAAMRAWAQALRAEYVGKVVYAPGFAPGE